MKKVQDKNNEDLSFTTKEEVLQYFSDSRTPWDPLIFTLYRIKDFFFWTWYYFKHIPFRLHRGFWPNEVWSLDYTIVEFTLPRLRYFREHQESYPAEISQDEWLRILDKIIYAFEVKLQNEWYAYARDPVHAQRYADLEEGFDLFRQYFHHLWD